MKNIKFQVAKFEGTYTAAAIEYGIFDYGLSLAALRTNVQAGLSLLCEKLNEDVDQYEIVFEYDIPSLFDAYSFINAKSFASFIGMSNVLLNQYTQGVKKPGPKQVARILAGFEGLAQALRGAQVWS